MNPVSSLWSKWKGLRLPWRRWFLAGSDLSGNTFWEFKDSVNSNRFRRILKCKPNTHYGDVQVSPQWHQWLRYVRPDAPSIQEQQQDIIRQIQIKHLAQLADERWASKPSYMDKPRTTQHLGPATSSSDATVQSSQRQHAQQPSEEQTRGDRVRVGEENSKSKPAPKGGPGENWQPESWTPTPAARK